MCAEFGLTVADMSAILAILTEFESVSQAIIYGSRATGKYRKGHHEDHATLGSGNE